MPAAKKTTAKSRTSKSAKSKKNGFKIHWWMAIVLVGIIAVVGVMVVRFSRASGEVIGRYEFITYYGYENGGQPVITRKPDGQVCVNGKMWTAREYRPGQYQFNKAETWCTHGDSSKRAFGGNYIAYYQFDGRNYRCALISYNRSYSTSSLKENYRAVGAQEQDQKQNIFNNLEWINGLPRAEGVYYRTLPDGKTYPDLLMTEIDCKNVTG